MDGVWRFREPLPSAQSEQHARHAARRSVCGSIGLSNSRLRLKEPWCGRVDIDALVPGGVVCRIRLRSRNDRCRSAVSRRRRMSIRTLVIDDEPIARHSITRLLRADPDIDLVGEYGDGAARSTRSGTLRRI